MNLKRNVTRTIILGTIIYLFLLSFIKCETFQPLPKRVKEESKQIDAAKKALKQNEPGAKERAISELDRCDMNNRENARAIANLSDELHSCRTESGKKDKKIAALSLEAGEASGIKFVYYGLLILILLFLVSVVILTIAVLALRKNKIPLLSGISSNALEVINQ
ncbi:hypothetical protein LEP1GSC020_2288 [Leptospira interrogans serovar Grippotyphosa str. 2006006986]|uniref:Uncharacterized protein n=1 Tax=Leptospira interrogans str. UI 12758 TaxID=1049938 RepID=A0A0E2D4W2_LEPIR|nr:hypothetical protein [Leptospira interrogans]EKO86429.1 hypothetical protein LEP1GSC009_4363 [Leptospira interrogans serovar Grippotyphosa str. Andaman]EKP86704.1 hypothetical protein LEP1GSC020_2288 [Leptospira interrogans serovar Grippotyphosa str. 2006006986]EKR55058.1 hypothetical protein LEP1GSC105_3781 [Leptospira interrogans str. UI 12758]